MNVEGRTQRGGSVPADDYGDGCSDEQAPFTRLISDYDDYFVTVLEGVEERDYSVLGYTIAFEEQAESDWIGSWGMPMEDVLSMDQIFLVI